MTTPFADSQTDPTAPRLAGEGADAPGSFGVEFALAALAMLIVVFAGFPIPNINEPHYFCKAKHFWDSGYCPGDFFLDSANTHLVFYLSVGWLTRFLSLFHTVIVTRILCCLLLAASWTCLVRRLAGTRFAPVWSVGLFAGMAALGNFSGEWIIGAAEAKVFSYAFALGGLGSLLHGRTNAGAGLLGLAVSFHPVVGLWCALCAGSAHLGVSFSQPRDEHSLSLDWNLKSLALAAVVVVLSSLPGLIPALQLIAEGSSRFADYLQVFYRLRHHLDPMEFPRGSYLAYGLLLAAWILLNWRLRSSEFRFLRWFVWGTILIAAVGWILGARQGPPQEMPLYELRTKLLKFYPFRLFDVMLPLAAAICAAAHLGKLALRPRFRRLAFGCGWGLCLAGIVLAIAWPSASRNPSRLTASARVDWIDACRWIARETPPEASFFTPNNSWAFKWYAERAEYVSYKDIPQDAPGILEWNNRLLTLSRWGRRHGEALYSAAALDDLQRRTGVTHLIAGRWNPVDLPPLYQNRTYAVYEFPATR